MEVGCAKLWWSGGGVHHCIDVRPVPALSIRAPVLCSGYWHWGGPLLLHHSAPALPVVWKRTGALPT